MCYIIFIFLFLNCIFSYAKFSRKQKYRKENKLNFDFLDDIKSIKCENVLFCQFIESLESLIEKVDTKLKENNPLLNEILDKGELYYVYAYTPEKVHITKQGSNKLEILEGVTDEFKRNLAEGYVLRYKDGNFSVDEELTEKSMNFELDFDNYKE